MIDLVNSLTDISYDTVVDLAGFSRTTVLAFPHCSCSLPKIRDNYEDIYTNSMNKIISSNLGRVVVRMKVPFATSRHYLIDQ